MKKQVGFFFSFFLFLCVSESETFAQGNVTFKGSFPVGTISSGTHIDIASGKAKVVMYPGVTYNDCQICDVKIWLCSAGYDGKIRMGEGGSSCVRAPNYAMFYVRKYCDQSCSGSSTSSGSITYSGSFYNGYLTFNIASGKAKVFKYYNNNYENCEICNPDIYSCTAGTDGKKRLGTGGSSCFSLPDAAAPSVRDYCSESCGISSDVPRPPAPAPTPVKKIPSSSDLPLGNSYLVKVLKRDSSKVPTEIEVTDGTTNYSGSCWVCDWCFSKDGNHPGGTPNTGGSYVKEPWCKDASAYCQYYYPDEGCKEIVVTAPGEGGGPTNPAPQTPPTPPDTGNNNPVGGPGNTNTPSDTTGTGTSEDEPCMCNGIEVDDAICGLVDEHKKKGARWAYQCEAFTNTIPQFIVQFNKDGTRTIGYEAEHNGYGLVSSNLTAYYGEALSYLATQGIKGDDIRINSGYRCPGGNEELRKKYPKTDPNSRHQCGYAVDIVSNTDTPWAENFRRDLVRYMKP